ncbi:tRNA methyltransferase 10 homolog C [Trichomycterus rosablanca]|uniref:tRNA methyltransferase 10 homolog C n=1 Tax=Trichomycterus rosablanca TaxID=2290929 RepID=UPI002F357B5B
MTLVRFHVVGLLRRFHTSLTCTLQNHKYASFSTPSLSSSCSALITKRCLSTSWPLRSDAPQQKDKMDLDIWKSVMRSQASYEEKPQDEGEEDAPAEDRGDSPLEASRKLVEMWRQAGKTVPENVSDEDLETLAELTTKSSKRKYLKYLAIKEGHKKANREKKEKKKAERLAGMKDHDCKQEGDFETDDVEEEGEAKLKNTYLMRFWSRSMDRLLGWRVAQAMQHGQPLVYDMSYDHHMSRRELENTSSQLMESEGWNRRSVDPFHLHFCNLQSGGSYQRELLKRYGQESWDRLLITATSQRHIDVFPSESLVYLTADSPNVLRTFDHSKVYIIGAMVDRSIQSGVSLANAKRLKLATARLPLDEYLHWDSGAKNLTLDQMIRILITAKDTGSWEKALEFVPKRKHDGFHQQRREDSVQSTTNKPRRTVNTHKDPEKEQGQILVSKQRRKISKGSEFNSKPSSVSDPPGQSKLRIALKSKIEERSKTQGKRNWWEEN